MIRSIRVLVLLSGVTGIAIPVFAQANDTRALQTAADSALRRAVETISEADFRAKLGALAHDSTRGRETPSLELERATEWVAAHFRAAGLRPEGDAGSYLQRFQLRHTQLDSLTTVSVSGREFSVTWTLGSEITHAVGGLPVELDAVPLVLLAGIPADTLRPFGDVSVQGAAILHVIAPDQLRGSLLNPVHIRANAEGAVAHIVAIELPAERWTQLVRGSFPDRWEVVGVAARDGDRRLSVFGLQLGAASDLLRAVGEDPTTLTKPTGQGVRPLNGFAISVTPHYTVVQEPTVANVVGVLEGSDPNLREEAIVFTSHMDHVGVIPGRCRPSEVVSADSVCNGADDNASGTVGVIELAEAYAALPSRPARTLIFAAMTAEERGLCGSRFYVDHPVVPLDRTTAVINLDMIARNPRDTVGFLGKDYTSLGALIDSLIHEHPELHLMPTEHAGRYGGSDHYPFAQRGVPALFFFSGEHDDLHTAADNPERADAEQAARIVQLAFLVGLEVANAVDRPIWDPEARKDIVVH
jgi:hypothetical protein